VQRLKLLKRVEASFFFPSLAAGQEVREGRVGHGLAEHDDPDDEPAAHVPDQELRGPAALR